MRFEPLGESYKISGVWSVHYLTMGKFMPSNSWKIKSTTMRSAWQPGPSASQFGTTPSGFGVVRHDNAESGFVTCLLLRGL